MPIRRLYEGYYCDGNFFRGRESKLAAERVHSCTGRTPDGEIRVNIVNSDGELKATLFEGTSHSSWDTYQVTEDDGTFSGTDRNGREFEARIDGSGGRLVKAVAPDETSSSGETVLNNVALSCS
jgi:hypothetical protein